MNTHKYIIYRKNTAGFFSNFFHVLGHLFIAESKNLIPLIDMERHKTFYNEKELINGSANAWEYYFKPISNYSLDTVYNFEPYVLCDGEFPHFIYDLCADDPRGIIPYLIEKYIHLQEDISNEIDIFLKENFNNHNVLGIHLRGWELGQAPEHPTPPTVEQVIRNVYLIMAHFPVDRIFISTEQIEYLSRFQEEFGDKLLYTQYYRTPMGVNAYKITPHPRKNHMYLLGREVLVDAILLSRADYFLAGGGAAYDGLAISNVALAAQIFNNNHYKKIVFINNGFNLNNGIFVEVKKQNNIQTMRYVNVGGEIAPLKKKNGLLTKLRYKVHNLNCN